MLGISGAKRRGRLTAQGARAWKEEANDAPEQERNPRSVSLLASFCFYPLRFGASVKKTHSCAGGTRAGGNGDGVHAEFKMGTRGAQGVSG